MSILLLSFPQGLHSQQARTFTLSTKIDIPIAGSSLLWTGANLLTERSIKTGIYHRWEFTGLDKIAPKRLNTTYAKAADIAVFATGAMALIWLNTRTGNQKFHQAGILAENVWLTWNITQTTKMLARRARPYTNAPGFVFQKRDDSYSFISGHSAIAASIAGSMIVMNRQYCCTGTKRFLLYTAGGLAIGTGVLRIAAGKHYPSDVLAGFIVGMGVAYINSKIHGH